jgi:cardiolipin synthase
LRGVDVRILLPMNPDSYLVHLASFSYIKRVGKTGVNFFRYREGFMHQKVLLVDENAAAVGTANMDNRSFRLNFVIMMLGVSPDFAAEVEAMFLRDFERSDPADPDEVDKRNLFFQFSSRFARLLSPVL